MNPEPRFRPIFEGLPAEIRSKFSGVDFNAGMVPGLCARIDIADGVPCIDRHRYITWFYSGGSAMGIPALEAGKGPIPTGETSVSLAHALTIALRHRAGMEDSGMEDSGMEDSGMEDSGLEDPDE
jgi:hypothetical protein